MKWTCQQVFRLKFQCQQGDLTDLCKNIDNPTRMCSRLLTQRMETIIQLCYIAGGVWGCERCFTPGHHMARHGHDADLVRPRHTHRCVNFRSRVFFPPDFVNLLRFSFNLCASTTIVSLSAARGVLF